ncbi:LysE/ArgO family amino acid transporter [Rhizobium halophytocola]|uniref:L-lysine exporter family protein LysE/ArgO n=1 Tax=Rhizobium halophytocola TaxID=735519 RepID=A0ABS4E5N8_9HYPH|nr:LysE/ArgO family amino acid transporter [Rhizobium halophytocola]MBP1853260.1 L-lysine exporter family protein LysE/ArgO [Rhizobium halophytocola]
MAFSAALTGFSMGLSLIVAIGAQNAFVLRQGLRREHVLPVVLTCALSDALLIALGVTGLAAVKAALPLLEPVMRYGGAAFLLWYAVKNLISAVKGGAALDVHGQPPAALKTVLATTLALTFLNPHVYLDTVVFLGSISTQFPGERLAFALGAITASFAFFFSLGFGARRLTPLFARPLAWRVLDGTIAALMTLIAFTLVKGG